MSRPGCCFAAVVVITISIRTNVGGGRRAATTSHRHSSGLAFGRIAKHALRRCCAESILVPVQIYRRHSLSTSY